MNKHTSGPWGHRNGRIYSVDNENLTIANIARAYDGDYSPANGDLIASAPELLDALMQMVAIHDEPSGFDGKFGKALDEAIAAQRDKIDERISIAMAAIAKAKGV